MLRKWIVLIGLLTSSAAFSQSPIADLYIGAKDGEVRLLWVPGSWNPAFNGYIVKRRANGEWQQLCELIAPTQHVKDYFLKRGGGLADLRRELLTDPPYAHKSGFAYIDRSIPKSPAKIYEYGIFVVENNQPHPTPAATATWETSQQVDLDVGLMAADDLWDDKGVESFFKVDSRKLMDKAVGFRFIEHRGEKSRDVYGLVRPHEYEGQWDYICRPSNAPYPDAVTAIVEDNFGFQVSVTTRISERAKKMARASVPPRKCWEPVMTQVGGQEALREPRRMR